MSETPQGYQGPLPANYVQSSAPQTPNLGLTLTGIDPILAYNLVLIDTAVGVGGTSVLVNGVSVSNPNFNGTTPAAPASNTNVIFQVSGSNVSAYFTTPITSFPLLAPNGTNTAPSYSFASAPTVGIYYDGYWTAVSSHVDGGGIVIQSDSGVATSPAFTLQKTGVTGHASFGMAGFTGDFVGGTAAGDGVIVSTVAASKLVISSATVRFDGNVIWASDNIKDIGAIGATRPRTGYFGTSVLSPLFNAATGFQIAGAATSGQYLRGNGTNFVSGSIVPGDLQETVNAQSGTTYTVLDTDRGKLVSFTNASPIAVTLPQAGAGGSFAAGWFVDVNNEGAGLVTITPTTSTIDGLASSAVAQFQGYRIISNGTNYLVVRGVPIFAAKTANTVFAGPTTGAAAIPTFRSLVALDYVVMVGDSGAGGTQGAVPAPAAGDAAANKFLNAGGTWTVPSVPAGTVTWNAIGNASGTLTLANAGFATTFNQTSAVAWTWANTTAAVVGTPQNSPSLVLSGQYFATGNVTGTDTWTIAQTLTAGLNGASALSFTHAGTTGTASVVIPGGNLSVGATGVGGVITLFGSSSGSSTILGAGNGTQVSFNATTLAMTGASGLLNATNAMSLSSTNGSITLKPQAGSATNTIGIDIVPLNNYTATTTTEVNLSSKGTFAPASGSANFEGIFSNPTINQTGGANGTIRVLGAYPVNTAVVGTEYLLALGTSSASGPTGTLTDLFLINSSGVITNYASATTVGQGVPSEIVTVDLTAQSAAIAATNLTASAPRTGMYRISMSATITTVASTSSVLGGTNGFQIGFTSPTDSVAKTTVAGNSITTAANTTATAIADTITVYAKTGTAITYAFDYSSVGVTAMLFELHLRLESL